MPLEPLEPLYRRQQKGGIILRTVRSEKDPVIFKGLILVEGFFDIFNLW